MSTKMTSLDISKVCQSCGVSANVLTCLKIHKRPPLRISFEVSTWHEAVCDVCGKMLPVTQPRDFYYPDFTLLLKVMSKKKK